MPVQLGREDLRIMKTEKALDIALLTLLKTRNFRKITVKDICDAALISRATFYAHFTDKYAFLKDWLVQFMPNDFNSDDPYEFFEDAVNQFVYSNEAVIKNLINSADDETVSILYNFLLSTLHLEVEKNYNGKINPKFVVFQSFCAGGLVNYLQWQIKNKFPSEVKPMNVHLYEVLEKFKYMHE